MSMMVTSYEVEVKVTITQMVRVQVPTATPLEERDEACAAAVKLVRAMEWGDSQVRDCRATIEIGGVGSAIGPYRYPAT